MTAVISRLPRLLDSRPDPLARVGHLEARIATRVSEIEAAQRLRHRVFVEELGARPDGGRRCGAGLERDMFDPYCEHLIVTDLGPGRVVGTYRILAPHRAREIGCLYSDGAFWLTRLDPLRDALVELGRSCVDPDYRNGTVIRLLWAGLWAWLAERDHRYLLGCASVPMNDGGLQAAALYESLVASSPIEESRRVWPRRRLPAVDHGSIGAFTDAPLQEDSISMPPLVKGYLRAGARVIGEPHHDRAFVCADFPMLLEIDRLSARYRRHFGGH